MSIVRAGAGCLALAACVFVTASTRPRAQAPAGAAGDWRTFEGSWSATGQRFTVPTETGGEAAALRLSGSIVLTTGEGLSRGFQAVVVGFDDGSARGVGRAVWTDERGDRIFAAIDSDGVATGRRFAGTFTGGTGRYAGIAGSFSCTWQYVAHADDGTLQARAASLRGQFKHTGVP